MIHKTRLILISIAMAAALPVLAQDTAAEGPFLITNVDVFDDVNEQ